MNISPAEVNIVNLAGKAKMDQIRLRIGFLGGGQMALAIAGGFIRSGLLASPGQGGNSPRKLDSFLTVDSSEFSTGGRFMQ